MIESIKQNNRKGPKGLFSFSPLLSFSKTIRQMFEQRKSLVLIEQWTGLPIFSDVYTS
jgi:hypothetical protein